MPEPTEDVVDDATRASLAQLGSSWRALQDVLTGTWAPPHVLDAASAAMAELTTSMAPYRREMTGEGDYQHYARTVIGHALTPEFEILERTADSLRGTVRFGRFYRNAFGIANGGAIALMFDTAMASLGSANGVRAYTASITVDFRSGAPIDADLTVLVARGTSDGRKHALTAQLLDGDVLLADASCLMIQPKEAQPG